MRKAAYRGRECHASCVRTHLHYLFSCFWQHFCLIVSFFICRNLTLSLIKKKCVHQKQLFFSNNVSFCCHEIRFFYIKLFLRSKVSQNAFNFNQIESWIYSIFSYDVLLWKNPVQCSAGNKIYFIFLILFKKIFNVDVYRVCLILLFLL